MDSMRPSRIAAVPLLLVSALLSSPGLQAQEFSGENCSFRQDPDAFLMKRARIREEIQSRTMKFARSFEGAMADSSHRDAAGSLVVDPNRIPRNNFIDEAIFGEMAKRGVKSAPVSSDAEFVRRIYLDLTGRIPTSDEVRKFLSDREEAKRYRLIQDLLHTEGYVDKWTWWLGEWVSNKAASAVSNAPQQVNGRNAYYKYLWSAVMDAKPLKDIAYESITAVGNNYDEKSAATNFMSSARVGGGPNEDIWDWALVKTSSTFLGLGHYDCLLCHNGRGHLESLSVWATRTSRHQAEQMSSYFTRLTIGNYVFPPGTTADEQRASFWVNSFNISDDRTRTYNLRTTFGNRPNRTPMGTANTMTPAWSLGDGAAPASGEWRREFAEKMLADRMFARNVANRIWKQMFNMALADPVDQLDPDRLDPKNPPPAPWTFQATHPQLLEDLADWLIANNFNMREFLRLISESSAYQLSSQYDGNWTPDAVPLFARHFVRRLEAEEIHDAIVSATGVYTNYAVRNWPEPMRFAMKFPDTSEGGGAVNFLNAFLRGNRELVPRQQSGSSLQQLYLMNDAGMVTNRIKVANSAKIRDLAKVTDNAAVTDELFLTFLSRYPSDAEKAKAVAHLAKAGTAAARNTATEDLAWALINKLDFIFSY